MNKDDIENLLDGTIPSQVKGSQPLLSNALAALSLVVGFWMSSLLGFWETMAVIALGFTAACSVLLTYHNNVVVPLQSQLTLLSFTVRRMKDEKR